MAAETGGFAGSAEENDVGVVLGEKGVQGFGEAVGGPAFGGAIGCTGADGDAEGVGAGAGFDEEFARRGGGLRPGLAGRCARCLGSWSSQPERRRSSR